jgi:fumarylacetoacetate (FAA) hydrolase
MQTAAMGLAIGENARMKLASYKDGSRDGQLVVVSRDLTQAHYASHIANRLQQVLDDWNFLSPQLQDVFDALNAGRARHAFAFDPAQCMAPLPRAYQCVSATAWASHAGLLRRAAGKDADGGAGEPATGPELLQLAGDALLGAHDPMLCATEALGLDFGAGLAAITGDIPQACASDRALDGVRLFMLCNTLTLRGLAGAAGPAGVQSRSGIAFSPVAITPDELGEAWGRGRVQLPLQCSWNGRKVGLCDADADMGHHFGQLIALLARTRAVRAGSILAAAPLSNAGIEKRGQWSWPKGYNSIAEKRAMETVQDGQAATDYLRFGDTVRIEMKNAAGHSLFGAIEQEVTPLDN